MPDTPQQNEPRRTLVIPELGLCEYRPEFDQWHAVEGDGRMPNEVLWRLHRALAYEEATLWAHRDEPEVPVFTPRELLDLLGENDA